jgi:hypothetical protein
VPSMLIGFPTLAPRFRAITRKFFERRNPQVQNGFL